MKIVLYTTPTCGYCHQVKAYLNERGIRFIDYDVSRDSKAAEEMVRVSGQMGVPVIVVNGEVVVGFNRPRLEQLLESGKGETVSFGISISDAGKTSLKTSTLSTLGAFVGRVATSSLGERAGLKPGDIIIRLNNREIHDADDLADSISDLTDGDRVVLDVLRDNETIRSELII